MSEPEVVEAHGVAVLEARLPDTLRRTGGPVHDATVVAYLLKPSLFSGREANVVVDSREGPTFGQTIVDWYDGLKQPKNVFWVENGDAQGFFDLLTERLARLK